VGVDLVDGGFEPLVPNAAQQKLLFLIAFDRAAVLLADYWCRFTFNPIVHVLNQERCRTLWNK